MGYFVFKNIAPPRSSMGFTCFIAYNNARLKTIEKKYILLRDFSQLNERTSQRANYTEGSTQTKMSTVGR